MKAFDKTKKKEVKYPPTGDLTNKAYVNREGRIVIRNLWGSDGRGFFPCG